MFHWAEFFYFQARQVLGDNFCQCELTKTHAHTHIYRFKSFLPVWHHFLYFSSSVRPGKPEEVVGVIEVRRHPQLPPRQASVRSGSLFTSAPLPLSRWAPLFFSFNPQTITKKKKKNSVSSEMETLFLDGFQHGNMRNNLHKLKKGNSLKITFTELFWFYSWMLKKVWML